MRQVPGCVGWGLGLGGLMCPCGGCAQQSQKEYIRLDGKVVEVETNAFVGLTVDI